ncbi:MAG: hypothetical protein ACRCWF_13935 [Beijerinckiaceae bacterium]
MSIFTLQNGTSAAVGLVALTLLVSMPVTSAQAQARDRCNDYANEMISMDQRARQMQCRTWNKPRYTYQGFYNVCQRSSASKTQDFINQWGSDLQRCSFAASGSPAAQPQRPPARPAGATLQSGNYAMMAGTFPATVTLNVQGTAFSGQSSWTCCPGRRVDPIVQGRIANGRVSFVRVCTGQGWPGACRQTYTGVISGNSASGTWSGTGGSGRWSMTRR